MRPASVQTNVMTKTTTALSSTPNLRRQYPPTPDLLHAAYMYLSAKHDGDELRIEWAGRHLEFIADLQLLADSELSGFRNGSAR